MALYRREFGLTQKDLAERLGEFDEEFWGVNSVTISRWETGTTLPGITRRKGILRFLVRSGCLDSWECRERIRSCYPRLLDPLSRLFESRFHYIIGNYPCFPDEEYIFRPLRLNPRRKEAIGHILDIERVTNVPGYYRVDERRMEEWVAHPGSFAMSCERKGQILGYFLMLRIDSGLAEEIAHKRHSEFEISREDLRMPTEEASWFIHGFHGANPRIAARLNVEAYLALFDTLQSTRDVLIFNTRADGKVLTENYGISIVARGVDERYGFEWNGMLSPVEEILFSQNIVRRFF